jgi:hypothetical protein
LCCGPVILTVILLASCQRESSSPGHDARYELSDLQSDFEQFRNLIRRHHPKFFTDIDELHATIATQRAMLRDRMTELEFLRVLAPVAAAVRCGHTRLSPGKSTGHYLQQRALGLPLEIRAVGDSLCVVHNHTDDLRLIPGTRIVAINGVTAAAVIGRLKESLPADGDNETYKYFLINQDFARAYCTYVEDPEQFELELHEPGSGRHFSTTLSRSSHEVHASDDEMAPVRGSGSRRDATRFCADSGYAVLSIPFFPYDDRDLFTSRLDRFFVSLALARIPSLIVDLRGNDGGDPYAACHLFRCLMDQAAPYFSARSARFYTDLQVSMEPFAHRFTGETFVLMDGGSYSTTGHLCSLLKHHALAQFVGTESGGSHACGGAYREYTLKHSGITLLLPHRMFIAAAQGQPRGRGIAPDYPVASTLDDLRDGRDSAMQAAVALAAR